MTVSPEQITDFQNTVWRYYLSHKREMPWRSNPSPYFVLVSEMMLQQTQVSRVLVKFESFIARFPDLTTLAAAPLSEVIAAWNGLGYNRRAKFLWQTARQCGGKLPGTIDELVALPGIGVNTAGAILAYAYNQPVVFVETNIRSVVICHFFADHPEQVSDAQIREIMVRALPAEQPREWYWALMDYGTHIKSTRGAWLHKVRGYKTQSRFEGSRRQIRGKVLRLLLDGPHSEPELAAFIADDRLHDVLRTLHQEGIIMYTRHMWRLTA